MNVTCGKCGWVHFGVTRQHAEAEVARFNEFFDASTPEVQASYGRRSSVTHYERCNRCGASYKYTRPARAEDCPDGCTIGPIIVEDA